MSKKLVIVESPSKSKTIEQYLGSDYVVKSSKGHIRDLSISGKGGLGVDIENNFKPSYVILSDKKNVVADLNKALKGASELYLATDPDREGEAISWHLLDTLAVGKKKVHRVIFNEITKDAIIDAFDHPRDIDNRLVESQETRRILDRIIGFKLSKLLQSKIKSKSAGRVQSAALKLIVDREKEIESFQSEAYYEIFAHFEGFDAKLHKYLGHTPKISTQAEADAILASMQEESIVVSLETKPQSTFSKPPFITSTLQQSASTKYSYSSTKTMQIAQKLYEGVQIGAESIGLISYMRTDSTRLSDVFVHQTSDYIKKTYGEEYLGFSRKFNTKGNVQDAHEAIRPTSIHRTPDSIKNYLTKDEYQLYSLIYYRALASLMKPSITQVKTILIENNLSLFKATESELSFDGYLKVYQKFETAEECVRCHIPDLKEYAILRAVSMDSKELFTQPPARYSEARLIKEMEDLGIGRPSTYAQTIQTLRNRRYVTYTQKKFYPTEQGRITIDKLDEYFQEFIGANYSKDMENMLDGIASGNRQGVEMLHEFYDYFEPLVINASKEMEKSKPKETGEICPQCGSPMVHRHGRYGDFEACSNFPSCKYIKKEENTVSEQPFDTHVECPSCHKGTLIERTAKKGKNKGNKFYACSNYPKCTYISPLQYTGRLCPSCGNRLVMDEQAHIHCIDEIECGYHEEETSA